MGLCKPLLGDLYQKKVWTSCLVACHCHTHCTLKSDLMRDNDWEMCCLWLENPTTRHEEIRECTLGKCHTRALFIWPYECVWHFLSVWEAKTKAGISCDLPVHASRWEIPAQRASPRPHSLPGNSREQELLQMPWSIPAGEGGESRPPGVWTSPLSAGGAWVTNSDTDSKDTAFGDSHAFPLLSIPAVCVSKHPCASAQKVWWVL